MTETPKNKRAKQKSSRPDGWLDAGYQVPLRLTVRQTNYAKRAIGVSRLVYNLCVATHAFCRLNRIKWPSWQDLQKTLNEIKHDDPNLHFITEVSKFVAEGATKNFGKAIENWLNPDTKARKPKFHKKRRTGSGSFLAASGKDRIEYNGKRRIKLPYLGSVKLNATLPKGIIHEAHISFLNGQWLLSVNYYKQPEPKPDPDTRIPEGAADTGINPHATDSEGQTWENPKAYYKAERKLRRWQRAQARRKVGSRGWWEAQRRIDKLQRKIVNTRNDAIHKMTTTLVGKYQRLVIEDLHVAGLMKGRTPKAQADAGMGEAKRQCLYKGKWHHCEITLAPRFYPSSKLCSNCQTVNAKLKREKEWQCPACGTKHERNENAAVNLRNLLTLPAGSGATLRRGALLHNGKALAPGTTGSETGPDRRTATRESKTQTTLNVNGKKVSPSTR